MQRPPTASGAHEDNGRVCGSDEPQEHVDQVAPYGMLHADLASLLRGRVGLDEDAAEQAEESRPEDAMSTPRSASCSGCESCRVIAQEEGR